MSHLADLIQSNSPANAISEHLAGLSIEARVDEVRALSRKAVGDLYRLMDGQRTMTLDDFVPTSLPAGARVPHLGINTLPVFRCFEKHFTRATDREDELWGYNKQQNQWITGPGYFLVHPAADDAELFIDYRSIPDGDVPDWPMRKPNEAGLSKLVYAGMQDDMRVVCDGVSVGKARKGDKDLGQFFALVRGNAY
ncbi:MAG: hypothetical protein CMH55_05735 [Myxococcales bacterium]|nr:hypothetical protein [Myxococcales bacterium]